MLIAASGWVNLLRKVDWYPYKPSSWVFSDLQSSNTARSDKAWKELIQRDRDHRLSSTTRSQLVDWCLKQPVNQTPTMPTNRIVTKMGLLRAATGAGMTSTKMTNYVAECYLRKHLSAEQADRFFSQMIKTQLKLHAEPVAGRGLAISSLETICAPSKGYFWPTVTYGEIVLNGEPTGKRLMGDSVVIPSPGIYTISVQAHKEVFVGTRHQPGGHVAYQADEVITLPVEVE